MAEAERLFLDEEARCAMPYSMHLLNGISRLRAHGLLLADYSEPLLMLFVLYFLFGFVEGLRIHGNKTIGL